MARRKRRSWSDEEKRSICLQTLAPGVSVSQVARRYAMNDNQIFNWLKDVRFAPSPDETDTAVFLPIEVCGEPNPLPSVLEPDTVCRSQVQSVFERNFADATATRFEWHWKHTIVSGSSAVVAVTLTIHLTIDDTAITVPIRWTVSLIKRDDGWKWLHRHASAAAGSQEEGTAYPVGND